MSFKEKFNDNNRNLNSIHEQSCFQSNNYETI